MIAVSPAPVNRLEKAMELYHVKTSEILEKNRAKRQGWLSCSPATETSYSHCPEGGEPVTSQFDNKDLGHDVIDLLENVNDKARAGRGNRRDGTARVSFGCSDPTDAECAHATEYMSVPNIHQSSLLTRGNSKSR